MRLTRRRAAPAEEAARAEPAQADPRAGEERARGERWETARAETARTSPERRAERRRSTGYGARTRGAGATVVGAIGAGVLMIARLIMTIAALIALLIALAIVLRDVGANQSNTIVKGIHEGANFFAGSFTGLISFSGHPKRAITVNWGIALVVYLIVGAVLATMIARIGRPGAGFERRHRALPSA